MSSNSKAQRPSVYRRAELSTLRFALLLGVGLMARLLGSILTAYVANRIGMRLLGWPSFLQQPVITVIQELWILAVLPALCYGMARILELRPWSTALGCALAGEVFQLALDFIYNGLEMPWLRIVSRVATFAGGVFLTAWAVRAGRAAAEGVDARAKQAAEAKKSEYDAFVREAERLADRGAAVAAPASPPNAAGSSEEPK